MPTPVWTPGQVLTASDVNIWFVPTTIVKPSSQSVANTTLVNDNALVLAVAASSSYNITGLIEYNGANGGDIKMTFTVPAGSSGFYGATYTGVTGNYSGGAAFAWTDTLTAQGNGVGTAMNIRIHGIVLIGGTPGNLQLRWAQNTSNATATSVQPNSALIANRIS